MRNFLLGFAILAAGCVGAMHALAQTTTTTTPHYVLVLLSAMPTGEKFESLAISADNSRLFLITDKNVYEIAKQ